VFNRMADVYDARPAYPAALIDVLVGRTGERVAHAGPPRVGDIGAGIGHLALPLAARGLEVVAVEPAEAMLARLVARADAQGLSVRALHGAAEALPIADQRLDLAVVADALHFLDAGQAGAELGRVLAPRGTLALITVELAPTPFMTALVRLMEEAAPRRPRDVRQNTAELLARANVTLAEDCSFDDRVAVDHATLARIVRSISFIGPAMNEARFAAFWAAVRALPEAPHWARRVRLRVGRRR
jgi:ubiquinone/menaquinone biosynthesis C-methylase UbiE